MWDLYHIFFFIKRYLKKSHGLKNGQSCNGFVLMMVDEEIGGIDGMSKLIKSEKFKSMNVGFGLDEGYASPDDTMFLFHGERSIWSKWEMFSCFFLKFIMALPFFIFFYNSNERFSNEISRYRFKLKEFFCIFPCFDQSY